MTQLLPTIHSPLDLQRLDEAQLQQLAQEIRDELIRVLFEPGYAALLPA